MLVADQQPLLLIILREANFVDHAAINGAAAVRCSKKGYTRVAKQFGHHESRKLLGQSSNKIRLSVDASHATASCYKPN